MKAGFGSTTIWNSFFAIDATEGVENLLLPYVECSVFVKLKGSFTCSRWLAGVTSRTVSCVDHHTSSACQHPLHTAERRRPHSYKTLSACSRASSHKVSMKTRAKRGCCGQGRGDGGGQRRGKGRAVRGVEGVHVGESSRWRWVSEGASNRGRVLREYSRGCVH